MDMERNSACPSVLEWENQAINIHSSSKATEITEQIGFPTMASTGSSSLFGNAARVEAIGFGTGLRLGPQREYEDGIPKILMSAGPAKRSRVTYQNMQSPCCQVEGCNLDLKSAKDYHRRHRICESHSKSPKVIVSGMERRFCQQCSRFHDLSEFDDKKRSCRRRLSDHNARRRRVPPESVQIGSAELSSKLHDQRQQKNLLLNGLPVSLSNSTWENANNTSMFGQAAIVRHSRLDAPPCFAGDEMHKSIFQLHMDLDKLSPIHSSSPSVLDQCLLIPTTNSQIAPNLLSAQSLLSSNSWSLNEGKSTSMEDGLVQGNYIHPVMRKSNSEPQNLSLYQSFSGNVPVQQGPGVTMVHSANHQQEYQFRASYDSTGFCSSHKNL